MEPQLHPDVEPIAWLLGTWTGEGAGEYPTIEPFRYGEEARFWQVGKPFLAYSQRTWSLDDGRPLHAEMGYWRCTPEGRVELVVSHPLGVAEIEEGWVRGHRIELETRHVGVTSSAKDVSALRRWLELEGGALRYGLDMRAVGVPLGPHLSAELKRL